jgi:dTDP-glucose 4,6-dehydratase/UDP-glucose 4-epimerase
MFDYELNVNNVFKMLEAIRLNNPACKFISFSSAAVYGNPETLPIDESFLLNPISPYGWHKLYTEKLCQEYWRLHGVKTVSLRIFSVYGEYLRKQLFWDIYQKTLKSDHVELFGTGNETRDFIYIRDLMEVLSSVIGAAAFEGEPLNVASGVETTIYTAATSFCRAINPKITISFNGQTKPGDPLKWRADIRKLRALGFTPRFSFDEGIQQVAQWIKKENK